MKNKSLKLSKIRNTNEYHRLLFFKFFFRRLRRSGKTWNEIADILANKLPIDVQVRSDLLNHYYQGTKVPSQEQLLRILKALSETKYSSSTLVKTVSRMTEYNDIFKSFYDEDYGEHSKQLDKISTQKRKDEIKACKHLEASLSNLMDLTGHTEMFYDVVDKIIKKLAEKNG